ncbi:hypothetical protein BGX34_002216 [Mortierella sp. NVP85]|nr:hypothetical protein BGX34_002216 [Mortierella sp. NVP85]
MSVMRTIRTRKLAGWTLVLLVGYFMFSSTHRKLEHRSLYNKDTAQSPLAEDGMGTPQRIIGNPDFSERTPFDTKIAPPSNKKETSPAPAKVHEENPIPLSSDIPPPKTYLDPSVKYLGYMTYAGLTNQFIALENAAYLALRLGRTLIIPPITTNSHYDRISNQRWSEYFDFARFTAETGLKVVEWNDIRPLTQEQAEVGLKKAKMGNKPFPLWESLAEDLTCQIIYGFGDSERLHTTEMSFARQFLFKPQFVRPPPRNPKTQVYDRPTIGVRDNTNMDDIVVIEDLVDRYTGNDDQLLFLSHTFKLKDPIGRRGWFEAARHLYFKPKVMNYAKRLIEHRVPETKEDGRYIAIHVRRGDIWMKCASKPPEEMMKCITPLGFYAEQVQKAYQIAGKRLPVIVTTDSKVIEDHATMIRLGWRRLNHGLYTTEDELGVFGPAMVDAAILANAEVMIGSYSSSMSRVAERRQLSWHNRETLYPRTSST